MSEAQAAANWQRLCELFDEGEVIARYDGGNDNGDFDFEDMPDDLQRWVDELINVGCQAGDFPGFDGNIQVTGVVTRSAEALLLDGDTAAPAPHKDAVTTVTIAPELNEAIRRMTIEVCVSRDEECEPWGSDTRLRTKHGEFGLSIAYEDGITLTPAERKTILRDVSAACAKPIAELDAAAEEAQKDLHYIQGGYSGPRRADGVYELLLSATAPDEWEHTIAVTPTGELLEDEEPVTEEDV